MSKVLILGDGRLGSELHKQRPDWDVLSRKTNFKFNFFDVFSYKEIAKKYDVIINCIAYTNTTDNTKDKHWETNYKSVINLVKFCDYHYKKLIHISSDYIYSQSNNNATEEDIPVHLPTWYCYTKLLADAFIEAECENYLTIRTSFKERPWKYDNAWFDLYGNFDYTDVIAKQIIFLIENDAKGIYNVGTEHKNIYELAKQTKEDVKPTVQKDNPEHIRPRDISMDLLKYNNFEENIHLLNKKLDD